MISVRFRGSCFLKPQKLQNLKSMELQKTRAKEMRLNRQVALLQQSKAIRRTGLKISTFLNTLSDLKTTKRRS